MANANRPGRTAEGSVRLCSSMGATASPAAPMRHSGGEVKTRLTIGLPLVEGIFLCRNASLNEDLWMTEQAKPQPLPARTRCCIAGGGPAGLMLGFLLARAGIGVVVLEKHKDFLRDF